MAAHLKSEKHRKGRVVEEPEFDSCIVFSDGTYSCSICDIAIKQKKNVKPHLKSKKHADQAKSVVGVSDENVVGKGELEEVGFARDTANPRPGSHFLLEFQRPLKYKIARRLMKMACSCSLCLKAFRSPEVLSRHKRTREHLDKVLIEKKRRKLRKKLVAGVGPTHGELIDAIFTKYPFLLRKNKPKLLRKKWENNSKIFSKAAVCNEFGASLMKHSHCHMYCQTESKYTFKQFKKLFLKKFGFRISDIRRPVNFRECVRYVTKEDKQAVILNIPMKFTSTIYRAYRYFTECSSSAVTYGDYLPSTVAACDRKVFESTLGCEGKLQDSRFIHNRTESMVLLPWQQELIEQIKSSLNCDRAVFWVVDEPGAAGKSLMCQWLMAHNTFGSSILYQDLDYRTNSYLYNSERLVMFDVPRTTTPTDLRFVEDVKNGYLISTKYECKKKVFPSPTVIVFSNDFPVRTLLSIDRWRVYHIEDTLTGGKRMGKLISHPEFNV